MTAKIYEPFAERPPNFAFGGGTARRWNHSIYIITVRQHPVAEL